MNFPQYTRDHFSLILVALIFLAILSVSWNYIFLFIIALSIAVVTLPLHRKMIRKIPAPVSAGILTTLVLTVIIGICVVIIVVVSSDFEYFMSLFQTIMNTVTNMLHLTDGSEFSIKIIEQVKTFLLTLFPSFALSAAQMIPAVIIDVILFYALVYLSIIFGDRVWADVNSIIPAGSVGNVTLMAKQTKDILFSIYIVHVFIAILTFFLAYAFFLLLGYGHELFFSTMCALFALIPVLGPLMVIIFVGVYALCLGDLRGVILIATVGYFLTCVLTDLIIRPKLTGKRVKIRPMLMFVGFFGGAMAMGLLGFILGPVLLILGITAYEIFIKEGRNKKEKELMYEEIKI
ncbi:MAG TPA: AI-2E family transporter [Methanocorpusculum sp.]|nr:AI-2E family transporter [Methanocorpusculum sp.]HJJ50284.1 AI-2E family transporter [Methanocorpusculum sp.]HKL97839.1 AI-2E family transporter [Methanocorpusculum sp.]